MLFILTKDKGCAFKVFADEIYKKTQKLIKKYNTTNPFEIAAESGIMIKMCDNFKELKGLYTIIKRKRIIMLNSSLPKEKLKIVCAHELGHDMMHREFAKNKIMQEFVLYDMSARTEYEANLFAANILIGDSELSELACDYGYDMEQIAKNLNTDINLVGIKIADMNYRGFDFKLATTPERNFLAKRY